MWVRQSSIRPVASFARMSEAAVQRARGELLLDGVDSQDRLDEAFEDFETSQPALSDYVADVLGRPLGDATLALGYFLSLAIWMVFDRATGESLSAVSLGEFRATRELFALDVSLRESEPLEALETDDVISMEQPALVSFVHEHIDAALESTEEQVEPEELELIYRMLLLEILALSYAVEAPVGFPVTQIEASA